MITHQLSLLSDIIDTNQYRTTPSGGSGWDNVHDFVHINHAGRCQFGNLIVPHAIEFGAHFAQTRYPAHGFVRRVCVRTVLAAMPTYRLHPPCRLVWAIRTCWHWIHRRMFVDPNKENNSAKRGWGPHCIRETTTIAQQYCSQLRRNDIWHVPDCLKSCEIRQESIAWCVLLRHSFFIIAAEDHQKQRIGRAK